MPRARVHYTRKAIQDDLKLLQGSGLSQAGIYAILHAASWAWTERRDIDINNETLAKPAKFKGCIFWTEEAFKLKKAFLDKSENIIKAGLRHEHIVPKKIFRDTIDDYQIHNQLGANVGTILNAMNNNLIGCVVTKEEAEMLDAKGNGCRDKMPQPQDKCDFCGITDIWARYKKTAHKYPKFSKKIYVLDWQEPTSKNGSWKYKGVQQKISL